MSKIKVLVADDHLVVREGLVVMLQGTGEFEVVGQAFDGHEAIQLAEKLHPDVILIDVQMPGIGGIEAIRQIKKRVPKAQVVVLSSFDQEEYIYQSIQAGAKGYVLKDSELEELLDVIRAAARGESLLPAHIATKLVESVSAVKRGHDLTKREYEVLCLMARGMRNREIAKRLNITERTVKNHVTQVIAKLGVKSRTEAVTQALKEKLICLEKV
ncbi:MAG: response regulator transcription factor [Anaerolineae bacterium]|nr:response regulator transcription factor [Anaerolineae bacterium]